MADDRASPIREFMQILFAKQHSPGVSQPLDDFGILLWNSIFEQRTRGRRRDSGSIDDVFDAQRNTVKRSTPVPTLDFGFGNVGLRKGSFSGNGNEGIQNRI